MPSATSKRKLDPTELQAILDRINFFALGLATDHRSHQAKSVALLLHAGGPQNTKAIAAAIGEEKVGTVRDCVLAPCSIFRGQDQSRLGGGTTGRVRDHKLWSLEISAVQRAEREHPAPTPEPVLSEDEIRDLFAPLYARKTAMATVELNQLGRIAILLREGPRNTVDLKKQTGLDYAYLCSILNSGVRLEIQRCRRNYTGRTNGEPGGQEPAQWSLNVAGLRTAADRLPPKPQLRWPINQLPTARREGLEVVHFAVELTETQAWWIANIIAMIYLAGGQLKIARDEMGADYGLQPGTLRKHVDLANEKGFILLDASPRKESRLRPINVLNVNEARLAGLRDGRRPERPLTQGRSLLWIRDLWPETDRRTVQQRRIVDAIDKRIVGLPEPKVRKLLGICSEDWFDCRPLLALCGPELGITHMAACQELGCTKAQLTKLLKKLKLSKLFAAQPGRDKRQGHCLTPAWSKFARVAGDELKAIREATPSKRATAQSRDIRNDGDVNPAAAPRKGTVGRKLGTKAAIIAWLRPELAKTPDATTKDLLGACRLTFPPEKIPKLRSFTSYVSIARRPVAATRNSFEL